MKFTFLLTALLMTSSITHGANILGVFPTPSLSHHIVYRSLIQELLKKGHTMTIITTDPVTSTDPIYKNLTQIDLHDLSYSIYKETFDFVDATFKYKSHREVVQRYYDMLIEICDAQFSTPGIQNLIHDKDQHFDLIINEAIVPVGSLFKERFQAPLILITSIGFAPHQFDITGNPTHPVLYPDNFATYDPRNLWIWDKVYLIYRHLMYKVVYYGIYGPRFNKLAEKYFGPDTKSVFKVESEADMLFVNYNPVWHGVRPLVPAIVGIAGMHIKPPNPLPENLQKFIDEAEQGVIYISFGSNVKAINLPDAKRNACINAFRDLPYKVIWKWEDEDLPGKPKNVYINKWLPQMSILAHPNVKLFITQAGQQSIEEAVVSGVPMVTIPFVFDQEANGFRVQNHGIGKNIPVARLNEYNLKEAIIDVVTNPSYRNKIAKMRDLISDQPQSTLERAVWWTEYVIRHKGAKHLRSPAADVPFYVYFMLDVLLFLVVSIGLTVYPIMKLHKMLSKYNVTIRTDPKKIS